MFHVEHTICFIARIRKLYAKIEKLSNKVILALHLSSKYSFTLSKLRFLRLRAPKTNSFYTTLQTNGLSSKLVGQPIFFDNELK